MSFNDKLRRTPGILPGWAIALAVILGGTAFAQGTQTGVISGTVKSTDGRTLPGVAVTITSPALQGQRTAATDENGGYIFRGLPPGTYKVAFALTGFAPADRTEILALGATNPVDVTLSVAQVQESIEVTAESSSVLTTTQVATNYRAEAIDKLAVPRTLAGMAELAPGLTDNTPNLGQLSIAGGFAYDNVYLLNGVDINDNLFATANGLFIEDAVEEVQVLTNGISAEFGRFTGGVINAVTKRGGNKFSGSFRTDFTNSAWRDESKFEKEQIAAGRGTPHASKTNKVYQATLGGPIVRDRLWFFTAMRSAKTSTAQSLSNTGIAYTQGLENPRYEGKLTGSIAHNHTLSGEFISNKQKDFSRPSINATASIDPRTLIDRELPNNLFVANYNGVVTSNLFAEAQFSQKKQGFRHSGGTSTDIHDSPFMSLGRTGLPSGRHYNAPYFDSNDPEDRNNRQYTAALSYFLSTGRYGRHDLKVGGEQYTSWRTGGNSQSSTGFVFFGDPVMAGTTPFIDANGRLVPTFVPGVSRITNWIPVRGAQINLHTLSFYLNDRWQLNNHWNFNLGARYERHTADATQAGIVEPNSAVIVPRLGATFDVKGDGKWVLQASYAHYAGKAAETQFANNTNVGTPNNIVYQYKADAPAGQGIDFAPGFDLANYDVIGGSFPVKNVFLDNNLSTPITKEWTLQAGTRFGRKGEVKLIYADRRTGNLLEDFITIDQGKTTVTENGRTFGTFDNRIVRNTDLTHRKFQALLAQSTYRITDKWQLWANYTLQLKNNGNFEGEAANQPGSYSIVGDRPEFYTAVRHYPDGRLAQFQRHKVRLASSYELDLGRIGRANLGVLYRYDSPSPYSLTAANVPITAIQRALNPGYASVPTTQTLYFSERGAFFFEGAHLVDLALNYDLPVWRTARPYFKGEMRNAFNTQPLVGFDTTTTPDSNSPVDSLGLPTGYIKGVNFGKNTVLTHNPNGREFLFSVGFRF